MEFNRIGNGRFAFDEGQSVLGGNAFTVRKQELFGRKRRRCAKQAEGLLRALSDQTDISVGDRSALIYVDIPRVEGVTADRGNRERQRTVFHVVFQREAHTANRNRRRIGDRRVACVHAGDLLFVQTERRPRGRRVTYLRGNRGNARRIERNGALDVVG